MSIRFLRAIARDPIAVGSVWPSGPALARAMVEAADLRPGQNVVELGPGTGPFTVLLAGHRGPLLAIEADPILAATCRERCPTVDVVAGRAQDLAALLAERGWSHADRVVSGLPFAIWSDEAQREVLRAVVDALPDGGVFVTFTYAHSPWLPAGRRFRALLDRCFARVETSPVVWRNAPPALIYRAIRSRTPA